MRISNTTDLLNGVGELSRSRRYLRVAAAAESAEGLPRRQGPGRCTKLNAETRYACTACITIDITLPRQTLYKLGLLKPNVFQSQILIKTHPTSNITFEFHDNPTAMIFVSVASLFFYVSVLHQLSNNFI